MGPSLSLMPNCMTMARARFEACWMSPEAPVEMSSRKSFSDTRPPRETTMFSKSSE